LAGLEGLDRLLRCLILQLELRISEGAGAFRPLKTGQKEMARASNLWPNTTVVLMGAMRFSALGSDEVFRASGRKIQTEKLRERP
jgi:hypothetical protein